MVSKLMHIYERCTERYPEGTHVYYVCVIGKPGHPCGWVYDGFGEFIATPREYALLAAEAFLVSRTSIITSIDELERGDGQ